MYKLGVTSLTTCVCFGGNERKGLTFTLAWTGESEGDVPPQRSRQIMTKMARFEATFECEWAPTRFALTGG